MTPNHIVYPERFNQKVDFTGLRFGKMMPTDGDAIFEMHGSSILFYEFKADGADVPIGQERTFRTIVDWLNNAEVHACFIVCDHHANKDQNINGGLATVRCAYHDGEWHPATERITAREYTRRFFAKELIALYGREKWEGMKGL